MTQKDDPSSNAVNAGGFSADAARASAAEWEAAKMEVARGLGWMDAPQAKKRPASIGEGFEEWIGLRAENTQSADGQPAIAWSERPFRGSGPRAELVEPMRGWWKTLRAFALEERLAWESLNGPLPKGPEPELDKDGKAKPMRRADDGLPSVAPGHEERAQRLQQELLDAVSAGLPRRLAFRMSVKSVCQVAELAFWRSGLRADGGAFEVDSMMEELYSAPDDRPIWASMWACWDARAWGRSKPQGDAGGDDDRCGAGLFAAQMETPWDHWGDEAGALAAMELVWSSRWMKMALEASRSQDSEMEGFEASLWKNLITAEHGTKVELWQFAAANGVDPTVVDRDGLNALDWLLEPDLEQGSPGWFVCLGEKSEAALLKMAPNHDWITRREGEKTSLERALSMVTDKRGAADLRRAQSLFVFQREGQEIERAIRGETDESGARAQGGSGAEPSAGKSGARRAPKSL